MASISRRHGIRCDGDTPELHRVSLSLVKGANRGMTRGLRDREASFQLDLRIERLAGAILIPRQAGYRILCELKVTRILLDTNASITNSLGCREG